VGSSNPGSSPIPARSKDSSRSPHRPTSALAAPSTITVHAPDKLIASQGATTVRLVANQQYFGFEARVFRAGAERVLARMAAQGPQQTRIDFRNLGADFHLDAAASWTLLSALLAGGLLRPDGMNGYHLTERFRQYALASVVAPLSRARARALIETACSVATRINAESTRNPFQIKVVAVSGSYMSRRDPLPELSLWVVLRPRWEAPARHSRHSLSKGDALRQILTAVSALSSFIVVRIVAHRRDVQRPFSVVFQASEDMADVPVPAWDRVRDWGASISRRLHSK